MLVALVGQSTSVFHVVGLLFLIGWLVTPLDAAVMTLMQSGGDDATRGRDMATLQAAMSGAGIASRLFAGVFGDLLGVRTVFLLAGAIILAGGGLAVALYRRAAEAREPALTGDRVNAEGAPG